MKSVNFHTIRSVAQRTGLKPHLIRTWERRYRAIVPQRTPTNRRVYAESDIEKLQLLKQSVERGHSISQIARLSRKKLHELLRTTPAGRKLATGFDSRDAESVSPEKCQRQALLAIADLNPPKLEQVLASAVVNLSRTDVIHRVIMPLFTTIGDRWAAGQLRITCEHMATIVVRSFLWDMLRSVELAGNAPKIVLATPVGQWHELGLLAVAVEAAECGWRPIYFGPNLPAEEIAFAVERTGAQALALYIAHSLDAGRLPLELDKLHRYINGRIPIFVGGSGCEALKSSIIKMKAITIEEVLQFREKLRQLTDNP